MDFMDTLSISRETFNMKSLPFMEESSLILAIVSTFYLYAVYSFIPSLVNSFKLKANIKPLTLIYYGFQFGVHGIGVVTFLSVLDLKGSWSCSRFVNPTFSDVKTMGLIYSAYIYFLMKMIGLIEPMMFSFRATQEDLKGSPLTDAIVSLTRVLLLRGALLSNPSGPFLWICVGDMIASTAQYGYDALASSSVELTPSSEWNRFVRLLKVTHLVSLVYQGLTLGKVPSCSFSSSLAFSECVYGLIGLSRELLLVLRQSVSQVPRPKIQ